MSRRDFARLAMSVKRGEHLGLPGVHYAQLPWLKVTGTEPLTVNLDGETTLIAGVRLPRAPGGSARARAAPARGGAGGRLTRTVSTPKSRTPGIREDAGGSRFGDRPPTYLQSRLVWASMYCCACGTAPMI